MSGRRAKQLRRDNPKKHLPELNMHWGPTRASRRQRVIERGYTRPGLDMITVINDIKFHRKLSHIFQDYSYQRPVIIGTNRDRMHAREVGRANERKFSDDI